ncbi:MAG: phosphorylcholine transferase LicD [Cyanobium sp.]
MSSACLSGDDLDRLHEVQLEMLLEVDRICRRLGVSYQLGAGSLLGAVRHGGFIPWDSDIDVVMLRAEYRRFLREAPPLMDPRFFLQTWRSDPLFPACFAKVRRHNSVFRLAGGELTQHHQGIYLDIFPFDPVWPESWWWRGQLAMIRFLRKSAGRLQLPHAGDWDPLAPDRPAGCQAWRQWLHPILRRRLILLPQTWKTAVQDALLRSLALVPSHQVVCLANGSLNWARIRTLARPVTEFEQTMTLHFEGRPFPVTAHYHQALCRLYGNYMLLPPPELRQVTVEAFRLPEDRPPALEPDHGSQHRHRSS